MIMELRRNLVINIKLIFIMLFCSSCGIYSTKGTIPAHINSISISPIKNESTEFIVADLLSETINDQIIVENILKLSNEDEAHSHLELTIKSVTDMPFTYTLDDVKDEYVDEWKITIKVDVKWYDLRNDELLVNRQLSSFGTYGSGVDISSDGLDNDSDGLIDSEDSDEYGSPRESALRISVLKVTELIINEVTSTW